MVSADMLLAEKGKIEALVLEKHRIEEKLKAAAGCADFSFLLQGCTDLADIIDEIGDISRKREEKRHAAFQTKLKFSQRIRRKAKDMGLYEQWLVKEYTDGHISLAHGRKMAEIIKLLRADKMEKAEGEAAEFYGLLDMGGRLGNVNEELSKNKARVDRTRRGIEVQLSTLERLEKEPAPDMGAVERHEERMRLMQAMRQIRLGRISALAAMPVARLLDEMRNDKLQEIGFPAIFDGEAEKLKAYLAGAGLSSKTAGQLLELAGRSEERLKHELADLQAFRQEVVMRKDFLWQISRLESSEFLPLDKNGEKAFVYLSRQTDEAKNAASRLLELEKNTHADAEEWERGQRIIRMKDELGEVEKAKLVRLLASLGELENIIDGKMLPKGQEKEKKKGGLVDSIMGLFR